MMDFKTIIHNLESAGTGWADSQDIGKQITDKIKSKDLRIIDLVKELDGVLTNADHEIRYRGVDLLTLVVTSLSKDALSEQEIQVLCEFLCLRLIDHKTMEKPVLRCMIYFTGCTNKPQRFNKTLLEVLKTKANIQKMDIKSRSLVYDIVKKVLEERRQKSDTIDSDLVYSLVHLIEGESNPENILTCFKIVAYVLRSFRELDPFIDDLFEWLAAYYPLDYTPGEMTSAQTITRADLVQALYECFYANQLNAANLQTLLLEKLDDNLLSTKIESLNCLIKCYEIFPVKSVKDYASTLWTFVRMTCLKKFELIDPTLLQLCYRALSGLTTNLSQDDEQYFRFVSEMYDELSIAFKKPEMNLFEPAARLMAHAIQPKLYGFNHVLTKLLPISLNAISSKELRPIPGLAYIFELLHKHHPGSKLIGELNEKLDELVGLILSIEHIDSDKLRLLNAMVCCKIDLQLQVMTELISKLLSQIGSSSLDVEECLARICLNYDRSDILYGCSNCDFKLSSIMSLVRHYKESILTADETSVKKIIIKLSIYLRLIILVLTDAPQSTLTDLKQDDLNDFLNELRTILVNENCWILSDRVGQIHGLVLNKTDDAQATSLLMPIFSSDYCQNLIPNNPDERKLSRYIYIPVIRWILKSLVTRNHKLSLPLINLLLNFVTSSKVDGRLALLGSQIFRFVQSYEDFHFDKEKNFRVFFLYKQKFYTASSGEIQIRYAKQDDNFKKYLLICALAVQIPHLPGSVYKKDYEWLMRELLIVLGSCKDTISGAEVSMNEELVAEIFDCIISLIGHDSSEKLSGLIGSLVDLMVVFAQEAKTLKIRKQALDCLTTIASTMSQSDLMNLRNSVCTSLKPCLSDRKRLVRQSAAEARLRWILIGQPMA